MSSETHTMAAGTSNDVRVPSLLDKESTGGVVAEGGFAFQSNVLLAYIPRWLAQEGFSDMVREAYGDFEARIYVPGRGYLKEFVEAKNHSVTPAEFWAEIGRFQAMAAGSPGTYQWFTLVSSGISEAIKPLVNGLRRLRGSYEFYEGDDNLRDQSYRDYERIVQGLGHSSEDATFLFEHVLIEPNYSSSMEQGRALFLDALSRHLPDYDLTASVSGNVFTALGELANGRLNSPISRTELEAEMVGCIPGSMRPQQRPVSLFTATGPHDPTSALVFEWAAYFGGAERAYPSPDEWNRQLVAQLRDAKRWISSARMTRRVRLDGSRRLSASLAIGSTFSAVSGYAVEMTYRDQVLAADQHADAQTPDYVLTQSLTRGTSGRLVVSVGIIRAVADEVAGALPDLGLHDASVLHLYGNQAVEAPQHANRVVEAIKQAMDAALAETDSTAVDLFYAGPAHLALFLGHRLNALAPIQCYEWTGPGQYVPTCTLFKD